MSHNHLRLRQSGNSIKASTIEQKNLTKTQLRRQRSRSVDKKSSHIAREHKISIAAQIVDDPSYFPEEVMCPACNKRTFNIIKKKGGNLAWFACALFSIAGGMCLCPFVINSCLEAQIICKQCKTLKRVDDGSWNPLIIEQQYK